MHVDTASRRFILYFHGFVYTKADSTQKHWDEGPQDQHLKQWTFAAVSDNGLSYSDGIQNQVIAEPYFRYFRWQGQRYGNSFSRLFYSSLKNPVLRPSLSATVR